MGKYTHDINDDLLVRYLLGETSQEESGVVQSWLEESNEHRSYFEQMRKAWELSRNLAPGAGPDEQAAWKRFQARVHKPAPVLPLRRFGWMRVAALFLLVIGAATLAWIFLQTDAPQQLVARAEDQVRKDTLNDGSVVTLNRQSELAYPDRFSRKERRVRLKGEAFFSVTPDKDKPFLIEAGDVLVRVVGTAFNVRTDSLGTEVIVESGIVQVTRNGKTVELHPGEKVRTRKNEPASLVKSEENEKLYNYYRSKEFVCDDTPLWKLAEVLSEAYGVQFRFEQEASRSLRLTTTFSNESLDTILDLLRQTFGIRIVREGNLVHVY